MTSVLNADTDRILAIMPRRDQDAIETVTSDFVPAVVGAIQVVYPALIHILNRFHFGSIVHSGSSAPTTLFRGKRKSTTRLDLSIVV